MTSLHPVEESLTAFQIAKSALSTSRGSDQAVEILQEVCGGNYPITLIQTGRLTRLLDELDRVHGKNAELQRCLEAVRAEIQIENNDSLAARILAFCQTRAYPNESSIDIACRAQKHFPGFDGLGFSQIDTDSNGSVQFRLPQAEYICFDATKDSWELRKEPIL